MRHEVYALDMPVVDATAGTGKQIRDLSNPTVYIHQATGGGAAFSVKVQVKFASPPAPTTAKPAADVPPVIDANDDWIDFDAGPITAPKIVPLCTSGGAWLPVTHVRIYMTDFTAGGNQPKALVAGFNGRTI